MNNGDYGVNCAEIIVFLNILLPHIVFSWLPSVQTKKKERLSWLVWFINDGISVFEVRKKKKNFILM